MTLNKYQELMERLTVSPELRERTLRAVEQRTRSEQRPKVLRWMPLAAAAVLMLALLPLGTVLLRPNMRTGSAASEATVEYAAEAAEPTDEGAMNKSQNAPRLEMSPQAEGAAEDAAQAEEMALPPEQVGSAAELEARTGLHLPELTALPFEAETVTYLAYADGTAEVLYEGAGRSLCLRVSGPSEDNSGVYEDFPVVEQRSLAGYELTVKGGGSGIALALWDEGEQSCSLSAQPALTEAELTALLEGLG
jgi:hypothetical protein